ncbi:glycosyltransferase family 4 protein [Planctomycetota bacterium]
MKVLMLGWEFPPYISGGLGTACYGLTQAMSQEGTEIVFVLPKPIQSVYSSHVKLASPMVAKNTEHEEPIPYSVLKNVTFQQVNSILQPYLTPQTYQTQRLETHIKSQVRGMTRHTKHGINMGLADNYGDNLYQEVHRYAQLAVAVSQEEEFDVIHAHDWMTYLAGIAVMQCSGKPLVTHIHSTEFDRSGENPNPFVQDIERLGMESADHVIAVSRLTRDIVMDRYGITPDKVSVVYNAIDQKPGFMHTGHSSDKKQEKMVLFLGRITMQKGPEYFMEAAKKVLDEMDNVKFVMAGSGDMTHRMIEKAAAMGISHKVEFVGFLKGEAVNRIFKMADLFVMPSVSEPFGLVPLEALRNDVPVLISKQSGVAEILTHALKVDFWDIQEMANKMLAVLKYPALQMTLRQHGNHEVKRFAWRDSAQQCHKVYKSLLTA